MNDKELIKYLSEKKKGNPAGILTTNNEFEKFV